MMINMVDLMCDIAHLHTEEYRTLCEVVVDRHNKRVREIVIDELLDNCCEWNQISSKKIPYEAIKHIAERMKEEWYD